MSELFTIIVFSGLMLCFIIVYAVIKSYFDNKRWEKHTYQILKQYREKYGNDIECENLCYNKFDGDVE